MAIEAWYNYCLLSMVEQFKTVNFCTFGPAGLICFRGSLIGKIFISKGVRKEKITSIIKMQSGTAGASARMSGGPKTGTQAKAIKEYVDRRTLHSY